jgi:hypothetical protein
MDKPEPNWSPWREGNTFDVRYTVEKGRAFRCKVEVFGKKTGHISTRGGTGKKVGRKKMIWVTWRGARMTLEQICQL